MKHKFLIPLLFFVLIVAPVSSLDAQVDESQTAENSRSQRVLERKQRIKTILEESQKERISSRCEAAQKILSNRLSKAGQFSESHDKKFETLINKISDILTKLENNGSDVADAKSVLEKVQNSNQSLKSNYDKYKISLSDATAIDCQNDPEGFKSSLEEARSSFKELRQSRQDLRKLVTEDLKKSLKIITGSKQ